MKRLYLMLCIILWSLVSYGREIPAMSMDEVIKRTSSPDTTYIINFWATWCAPCVEELPVFNELEKRYADKPVKVLLVSLDFKEYYPMKLGTFLQRKRMTPDVIWLSDTNPNEYIPKVSNEWQGSIPATMIVNPGKHASKFIEGQVTEKQVSGVVSKMMRK